MAFSWKLLSAFIPRRALAPRVTQLGWAVRESVKGQRLTSALASAWHHVEATRAPGRLCTSLTLSALHGRSYSTQSEVIEQVNEDITNLSPDKVFAVVQIKCVEKRFSLPNEARSGRQFKITTHDLIVINRISADVGEKIILEKVLLAGSPNFTLIGTPLLSKDQVQVSATVTEHSRTAKVIVFKKKRRKQYKRKKGHRQDISVLRINDIHLAPTVT